MNPRVRKALLVTGGSIAALLLIALVTSLIVVQTDSFRRFVRDKIIQAVQKSTGGRVEIEAFRLDVRAVRATIRGFVLHGTEPDGEDPLFRAEQIAVDIRLTSALRGTLDISALEVSKPRVNLIVFPDGRTNVPRPDIPEEPDDKSALDTIVDLAVGRFRITDGYARYLQQRIPFSAQGENLQVELGYDRLREQYRGSISLKPLFVRLRENRRLDVAVHLPVVVGEDKIELDGATLRTPGSRIAITGALEQLAKPKVRVNVEGKIDLPEIAAATGEPLPSGADVPRILDVKLDAGIEEERLRISAVQLGLGRSRVEASGEFRNAAFRDGVVDLRANLVVNELVRLTGKPIQASGVLELAGKAEVRTPTDYSVSAKLTGKRLFYRQGNLRLANADLGATIKADPAWILADPIRLNIAGGRIAARAELERRNRYRVRGNLSRFQLEQILAATGVRGSVWGATISGPLTVEGELDGIALRVARTNLSIVPSGRGIPLRGQLIGRYDGANEAIDIERSYLALPSSRLDFSGSDHRMSARLTSHNLNDFLPALALSSAKPVHEMPLRLEPKGTASAEVTLTGKLSSPAIGAHVELDRFQVQDRRFDKLSADIRAASHGAAIEQSRLIRGPLQVELSGAVGLRQWKPERDGKIAARLSVQNGDIRDVLALAGRTDVPLRGDLAVTANASGTVGDPRGEAELHIRKGEAYGEPVDELDARVSFGGTRIELSSLHLASNKASADLSAIFEHPLHSFSSGTLRGRMRANQVALARIAAIQKQRPGLDGAVQLNLNAEAILNAPEAASRLELVALNGTIGIRDIRDQGDHLGNLSAKVSTAGQQVAYQLESDFAGSSIQADGRTELVADYPTVARLNIRNLPVEKALAVSGKTGIEAKGLLSVRGDVSGTWREPQGDVTLELARAVVRSQPIDQMEARLQYTKTAVKIPSLEVRAGPNRLSLNGSFTHPERDFSAGDLQLSVKTNSVQLAQVAYLKQVKPGLAGTVQVAIDAAGRLDRRRDGNPVTLSAFSAMADAHNLALNGVGFGGVAFSAEQNGSVIHAKLDANIAESNIRGTAQVRMAADYPTAAKVSLQGIRYSKWADLVGRNDMSNRSFDALVEGSVDLSGPALQPRRMTGTAEFTKIEAYTIVRGKLGEQGRQIALRNEGPVVAAATPSGIEIRNARWTGPASSVSLNGRIGVSPAVALNLTADATVDLDLLQQFDSDINSEGVASLRTTITGTPSEPVLNGQIELRDAAYQQAGMLNGISKTNALIELQGATARIVSFNAETGGGDVSLSGEVARSAGSYRYDLQGRARGVRVRTEAGASVVADARFQLNGTDRNSLASGNVNIRTVSFNSRTDFGSMLSRVAPPPKTPAGRQSLLDAMRLNVNVRMGPNTTFRTTFAENLEATADLTVRGTASNPGMLGRVVITEGELVFFGTKYSVNVGTVSFYNPSKIEPVLNLNLATTARGVNIVLAVTGSVQNMNLAYQSDPPLQFSEIVGLLAVGKMPTSDPVLLAHQPAIPQQTLPQMGASALLSSAVANPVAGQLERIFGVTQLKIDPTFTSGSELPQARLTLQQQITSELTFTYITNVTRSDPQIVRAEWVIDSNWSAIATRQENGMVGVDLFFKKSFQ
jgi:translocation and assembly module TamB